MSFSAAIEEQYASGDDEGVCISSAEIDHPSFDAPIRVVTGIDAPGGGDGDDDDDDGPFIMLPIGDAGDKVAHKPCAFSLVRPGADQDGPTDAKVSIDNISGALYPYMKAALGYGEPITVTFRQYIVRDGDLDALDGADEEIEGLQLNSVTLTAATADGTLAWPDGRKMAFPTGPNAFFDRESYPALFS